jgi:hypothetical protein
MLGSSLGFRPARRAVELSCQVSKAARLTRARKGESPFFFHSKQENFLDDRWRTHYHATPALKTLTGFCQFTKRP